VTLLKPIVPGTVLKFIGEAIPRIPPSAADTVAVPIVHDWGPYGQDSPGTNGREGGPQLCTSFAEFTQIFGDSDTAGRTAVAGAFAGQGLPGAGGAGGVLVYRLAGSAKAKATVTVKNATPTNALTLTGRYYGSRGNKVSYAIDVDPSNELRDRFRILYNGAVQETYLYTKADVKSLAEAINSRSQYVVATELVTGVALAHTAGVALTTGADGTTVTNEEHVAMLEALEFEPFAVISPYDVETAELLAAYTSWIQTQEEANRPVILVCGGAAAETLTEAITRSTACSNPHVVNLGVGTYHDDLLDKDLSTAQLAPRIAGILAARGKKSSLTFARISGLHIVGDTGAASDEVATAVQSGVCVLMRASSPEAELQIAKGVTTWTTTTAPALPVSVFGDPRLVRIMDLYVREMKEWGDDVVIGALPVNDDTRGLVRGKARELQSKLLEEGLILPGGETLGGVEVPKPFVTVEPPADPSLLDTIPYQFGWQFAYTTDNILGEGRVR
jgi:hypothetical protein